ncbi:MAG: hypothetical protein ACRC28_07455 [Clostridium sp.]|uniref:hypothetical protein n=1 Tax=Clostridium sp. TaxID=1506 RepID=UPI003F30D0D3
MGKVLISINSIKKEEIEFSLNEFTEITKESLRIFSLVENIALEEAEYSLVFKDEKYILTVRGEKSCYFYIKKEGIMSNIIYIFRKSVILNGNYIYTRIPLPDESYKTFFSDESFIKGRNVLAKGDVFELLKEIDMEKSYFVVDERETQKKIIIYLFSVNGGLIEGDYKVKLVKRGG